MKKIAPIILVSLLISQSPSRAIYGGPFDNNLIPGGGADGTYSAVLTGENLTGMATFGIGSYAGFEGNGRFAVFHEGAVHYGAVSGTADLTSKRVAGALLGVAALPTETTGGSATTQNAAQVLTVRSSAEGAFDAIIKGYPQQLLFEGDGQLSSTANAAVTIPGGTATTPVTIVIPSRTDTVDQGQTINAVIVTPVTSSSVVRSETGFKIRGSRTSTQPFTALNSYSAIPPLTPTIGGSPVTTPVSTPIVIPTPTPAP